MNPKTIMAAVGLVPSYQKNMSDNFRTQMFVGLFLTYDIIACRMISDFIFRFISYLPVGQSTVSP